MIVTEFDKKDGTKGERCKPENGDEIICEAESVYVGEPRPTIIDKGTKNERAVNITNRGISATYKGETKFITLTEGQSKVLKKEEPLTGKKVVFQNYTSEKYGTLLGARVQK